ncbi:MAG: hypothetical protein GC185_05425 [Alphaproteobacteria bacterium]|nr:hypothetical protein [Alphaproteobacteria bacterium]
MSVQKPIAPVTADTRSQRKFVIECWNGMMKNITETLAAQPEAVRWREDDGGHTGLLYAIAHGSHKLNVAQALLDAGADINARNKKGETALMIAASQGGMESIEWLLANGARLDLRDNQGLTAAERTRIKAYHYPEIGKFLDDYEEGLRKQAAALARTKQLQAAANAARIAHAGTAAPLKVGKPLKVKPRRP